MTNEMKQELYKAHIYGYDSANIADILGMTENEVEEIIANNAAEIVSKKLHMEQAGMLTGNTLAADNVLNTARAAIDSTTGKVYYGIDVSVWNGAVDMKKVKAAGKSFVFIRSGYGNTAAYPRQADARFAENVKNAKAAGLDFGVYHYCYALSTAAAKAEAQGFVKQLDAVKPIPHLVLLDIEEASQQVLNGTTKAAIINAFLDVVKAAGYYAATYSYEAFLNTIAASERDKWVNWVANINRKPSITHGGWQYSFTGQVNGISGDVDLDQTTVDYPAKIKAAGKNGYKKPTKKALDTEGFKRGDKSLGVYALKRRLIALGHTMNDDQGFGSGTEKAVNALLKSWGYKPNGVAGEKFIKKIMK